MEHDSGRMRASLSGTLWALALAGVALSLCSCAAYSPAPLPAGETVLEAQSIQSLAAQAEALKHPRLRPVVIDFSQPLTPQAVGVIAVIASPDLKAVRAKARVADAQLFAARLFPDPQINLAYDFRLSGPDPYSGAAGALIYELNAFRTHRVVVEGERASVMQGRLDIAWQELQTAGQARLLAVRIAGLTRVGAFGEQTRDAAQAALGRILKAAARGDVRADEAETRRLAFSEASDKLRQNERDLETARLALNKLLGLPPSARLAIASTPPSSDFIADAEALFRRAKTERLDLQALQAGYRSQEAAVHQAVLDAFPSFQLTLARTQDTAHNQTVGPAVNMTLPLWNRNRGGVAIAKATRAQLAVEYAARLFTIRADIADLVGQLRLELRQRADIADQAAPMARIVAATEAAAQRGDVAPVAAETARQSLRDKEMSLAALDQAMAEQRTALDLAVGGPVW